MAVVEVVQELGNEVAAAVCAGGCLEVESRGLGHGARVADVGREPAVREWAPRGLALALALALTLTPFD